MKTRLITLHLHDSLVEKISCQNTAVFQSCFSFSLIPTSMATTFDWIIKPFPNCAKRKHWTNRNKAWKTTKGVRKGYSWPVSSTLPFPFRYNFLPLSMRITSWILKEVSLTWKIVRKKVELQAAFFVRLVRSLINLWFPTNQIEETNKETKLRWEVDQSHGDVISMENSLEPSATLACLYQQQQQQE